MLMIFTGSMPFFCTCPSSAKAVDDHVQMLLEVLFRIDTLAVAEIERMAPQQQINQRSDNQAHGVVGIHASEFAARHTALQHRLHQQMSPGDDFFVVEAADLREIAALGKHQFGDAAEFGRAYGRPPVEHDLAQQLRGAAVMSLQQSLATFDVRHDPRPDHCLEQFLLAREIQIQGPFADAGPRSNFIEPGCGKPALDE